MWLSKCSAAYYQMSIVWIVQPITYWYACILYPLWTVYSVWPSCVPQCTVGDAFTEHVVIGKTFVAQKIFVTPSVLRLQQWFLHQYGEEFNHKSKSEVFIVWPVADREQEGQHLQKRCSYNWDQLPTRRPQCSAVCR